MRRGLTASLVAALLTGVAVLAVAPAAQAHNYLVASTPTAGQNLTALPDAFVITTNESLLTLDGQTGGFALQVTDSAGLHYETGCIAVDGPNMTMENPQLGTAGAYTVAWQVVSADGHSVSGTIPFTWSPPADARPATGSASAPKCGDQAPTSAPTSGATAAPTSVAQPPADDAATPIPLSDVLWIGGAILAVGIAVTIAILLMGRRKRTP